MKPLYLLTRHLPTVEDARRVYSDPDVEVPLLDVDWERMSAVIDTINALRRDRSLPLMVSSSTTERSTRTMQTLASGVNFDESVADTRLSNIRHPQWNGVDQELIQHTPLYRQWHSRPTTVRFPEGESLADVAERVDSFLTELPPERDYLIISHSTPLQVLGCRLLGTPLDSIWALYYEPYTVTAICGGALVRFNDVSGRECDFSALYE